MTAENKNCPPAFGRALIAVYSYSGSTHRIAREIQAVTGGDLCTIYPWQPYPMAFPELLAQVKKEIAAQHRPRLLPTAFLPCAYPVIFVGTPNWCGTIAPPLASWLHRNDLSGKILLPFYSHCGGVSGDMQADIARLCPKADVREALGVIDGDKGELRGVLKEWFQRTGLAESPLNQAAAATGIAILAPAK